MLVLSRKIGETITIGNSVKVTVLNFDRGIVRLGIEAPSNVAVHRLEIHDKIIEMNKQAAGVQLGDLRDAMKDLAVSGSLAQQPESDNLHGQEISIINEENL